MITKDALYEFTENLIAAADPATALYGSESFRNIRGDVDTATKVVRIECFDGRFSRASEPKLEEWAVRFTAQFWVLPAGDALADLDNASDTSFEMARQFYEAMADNPDLSDAVCDAYGDEFETGSANLGTIERGVTYIDGQINMAGGS